METIKNFGTIALFVVGVGSGCVADGMERDETDLGLGRYVILKIAQDLAQQEDPSLETRLAEIRRLNEEHGAREIRSGFCLNKYFVIIQFTQTPPARWSDEYHRASGFSAGYYHHPVEAKREERS